VVAVLDGEMSAAGTVNMVVSGMRLVGRHGGWMDQRPLRVDAISLGEFAEARAGYPRGAHAAAALPASRACASRSGRAHRCERPGPLPAGDHRHDLNRSMTSFVASV
jgi:hypothetical protein